MVVNLEKFFKDGENYNKNIPFPHCISDGIWDNNLLENIETEKQSKILKKYLQRYQV